MKQTSDPNHRNYVGSGDSSAEFENSPPRPKVGEPFSPYYQFHVLPMPDSLLQSRDLPAGAKLVYGRLCRYAGKNTYCWPTPATLAAEVGLGERQVQKHLDLLERTGYIRRKRRFGSDGGQMSNHIILIWHASFKDTDCLGSLGHQEQAQVVNKQTKRLAQTRKQRLARERALAPFTSKNGSIKFGDLRMYVASGGAMGRETK
jgi:hypothetical protein